MEKMEYRPLTIPKLNWIKKSLGKNFGELVAQPLEPGFGITIGNALRRVLLGAIEGSAVTSVIIKGVNNEFATLPSVVEDITQIMLNIKQIVIRNKKGIVGKMHLKLEGETVARVANIKADDHLELVNTDHVIAHISSGGSLEIEFFVETGRGYQIAQWPVGKALQEDGRIYLDAMFSPVTKITFDVEKTRVGGDIDYDKVIFKVHTDGSETPIDVVHYAVSVLRTQLEHFLVSTEIPFNEISVLPEEEKAEIKEEPQPTLKGLPFELLLKPIEELELSVRAHNCLVNAGIKRVIDLVNLNEDKALKIKNFGHKSLKEVEESLQSFGLSFGMNIKESDVLKSFAGTSKVDEEE
jgi:DNA-directed RNA polymerase subunit alpha